MSKLNIPTISAQFELAKDWEFTLYSEYRNDTFWRNYEALHPEVGPPTKNNNRNMNRIDVNIPVILPKGTLVSISRIYIRSGKADYDSITISIKKCPTKGIKGRFWVKLDDINEMEYVD